MLELSGLVKRFGNTTALSGLYLTAKPGEIVGVAGPNGAGKSTLIHVLAGEINEDTGNVTLDGQSLSFADRPRFVSVVHQELQLFPTLTVMENLLLGAGESRVFRPRPSPEVRAVAGEFGLLAVADRPLDSCSLVVKQLTEIARAMLYRKRIVLLDEPNSALTEHESDRLFAEVTRLKEQGRTIVLLVSHRLADLERYCDRVVVVREGTVATEFRGAQVTTRSIAQAIVGGAATINVSRGGNGAPNDPAPETITDRAQAWRPAASRPSASVGVANAGGEVDGGLRERKAVVDVRSWSDAEEDAFSAIDLAVHEGEALFITGQEDGGGRELLRSIAGLRRARGSATQLPRAAKGAACYVPGSRASSLFPNLSVRANLCIRLDGSVLGGRTGLLRSRFMNQRAQEFVEYLDIRTPGLGSPIGSLSGGTQQKVAIGSALAAAPEVLILEDPTRGVDVKTREQIVRSLRSFVEAGNAIIAFSPELDEVFELADVVRVAVRGGLSVPMRLTGGQTLEGLAQWVDDMNTKINTSGDTPVGDGAGNDWQEQMTPSESRLSFVEHDERAGRPS